VRGRGKDTPTPPQATLPTAGARELYNRRATVSGGGESKLRHAEQLGPLMVARAGGLLGTRRLVDSVVFDLGRGPGMVAQVLCVVQHTGQTATLKKKPNYE
jgi:hypothetical protein